MSVTTCCFRMELAQLFIFFHHCHKSGSNCGQGKFEQSSAYLNYVFFFIIITQLVFVEGLFDLILEVSRLFRGQQRQLN